MRFLLIMPKLTSNINVKYKFPIGIAYISAVLKANGFDVISYNPNHTDKSIDIIIQEFAQKYDVILSGALSSQFHFLKAIFDQAKKVNQNIITICGGGAITATPFVTMRALENVDIGVIGEGEETIVELCSHLQDGKSLANIKGIIWKDHNNQLIKNQERVPIQNLDTIPFPDLEGFDIEQYIKLSSQMPYSSQDEITFPILTARSCPYRCTFCFHTLGKKYRTRSLNNIFMEIDLLYKKYSITSFALSDELFATDKEKVRRFSQFMNERKLQWSANFRLDSVDDELISIIKNSTCTRMFFGIENINNNILKNMNKNLTKEIIEVNLKKVYDANIPFGGNLLFGDPADTLEISLENINWYKKHPEYNLSLANITCYPGTAIYKDAVSKGKIQDEVDFLKKGCPVINLTSMENNECASVQKAILECGHGFPLNEQTLIDFNVKTKQAKVKGRCLKCNKDVVSRDILFFTKENSHIYCPYCGAKHVGETPKNLLNNLINNIKLKLKNNYKIAIWGVQPGTWRLFNEIQIFEHDNITFIESNDMRRNLKITRSCKEIYSPEIFLKHKYDEVIFCYPNIFAIYNSYIKTKFPKIDKVTDILDLLL